VAVSHEKIVDLIGEVNGVNKNFTTPAEFIAGTERAIVNGVLYHESDLYFGWSRISTTEIQFAKAPQAGWGLQLFMQEAEMQGSPFGPGEE